MKMGFEEGKHFIWSLDFLSPRTSFVGRGLYERFDWDSMRNTTARTGNESGEFYRGRLQVLASLADFSNFDVVVDLGAANERIREFLPQHIRYIPVDYIKYSDDTYMCDLNSNFPDAVSANYELAKTLMVSSGNIAYITDWKQYLYNITNNSYCLLLSIGYALGKKPTFGAKKSHIFSHQIILEMQRLGFMLTDARDYRLVEECLKFEKEPLHTCDR